MKYLVTKIESVWVEADDEAEAVEAADERGFFDFIEWKAEPAS